MSEPSANRVRLGEPSRTAQRVALMRAAHQLLDEPLILADPLALRVLGPAAEAALRADPFVLNDPFARALRAALVVRSRFVEDELAAAVARGVRQFVLLGAGLDTFAYRNPHEDEGLQVYEVDHAGMQQWKRQRLGEVGITEPASLHLVSADFERDDPIAALVEAGFRIDAPACVSWMGVTPYLGADAIARALHALSRLAPGSCVCFDVRVQAALLDPIERVVDQVLGQQAAAVGEPWLSAFDPGELQRQLLAAGFASADIVPPEVLDARYCARRKDGLRAGRSIRLVRAGTADGRPPR